MKCERCGNQLDDTDLFCQKCGKAAGHDRADARGGNPDAQSRTDTVHAGLRRDRSGGLTVTGKHRRGENIRRMPSPFSVHSFVHMRRFYNHRLSPACAEEKNKSSEDSTIKKILFLQKYQRFFRPLTDADSRFTIVFASTE